MASKRLVNALICPHAPFLVPRSCWPLLTCTEQRVAVTRWPSTRSHFATKSASKTQSKFLTRKKKEAKTQELGYSPDTPDSAEKLQRTRQFREACDNRRLPEIMQMYPQLLSDSLFYPNDTRAMVQVLHTKIRGTRNRDFSSSGLLAFANILVRDLQARKLPPHDQANVHLLSIFKETKAYGAGVQLWQWLKRQDNEYVSPEVYGAAIELLAYQGETTLEKLEELYQEALKRYPDNFVEYHLSPEAVLPDRSQPMSISIKVLLLQGIITARLLHGDWRNAYIGLDICLRLFPTQTTWRVFELFMRERPHTEALPVFMMSCRSGSCPRPESLTVWFNQFAKSIKYNTVPHRILLLRGMITALQGFVGAGGQLAPQLLGTIVKALDAMVIPRTAEQKYHGNSRLILEFAEQFITLFYYAGISPTEHTLGSLITIAGKAGRSDVFESALNMMKQTASNLSDIQYRIVLIAAGQLGSKDVLERVWQDIVDEAQARGYQLAEADWDAFAYAGKVCQHTKYVESQIEALSHTLTDEILSKIHGSLYTPPYSPKDELRDFDKETLETNLQSLMATATNIGELLQTNSLLNFNDNPLPMTLGFSVIPASDQTLRTVYDKFSIDPAQPAPARDEIATKSYISSTGISLEELRFQNWKTVNELLALAERYEGAKAKAIDAAVSTGTQFERKTFDQRLMHTYSEADAVRATGVGNVVITSSPLNEETQSIEDAINSVFDKKKQAKKNKTENMVVDDVDEKELGLELGIEPAAPAEEDVEAVIAEVLRLRGRQA